MGANILIDNPLSPQLTIIFFSGKGDWKIKSLDVIAILLLTVLIVAPNLVIILIAAFSSLLLPKLSMTVVPGVISAAAQARCIELLEGGACIVPETADGVIVITTF